jgi:CheY-like chemotaxis protein
MVRISVTDTGMGIPAEFLPKLFTPFERIGADKTNTEGTGLGLSVVKKIIEVLDGHYGVESEPGVGSTFWIELPLSESPEFKALHSGIPASKHSLLNVQKGIILYVEDNQSNIELMEQVLNKERPEFILITEMLGSNVLERALTDKPNLILLDLNLPDMHGHEVLEKLKSDRRTKNIPVVVISADAMPQQLNNMLESGAEDYLTKPLELPVLIRTIVKYLQL